MAADRWGNTIALGDELLVGGSVIADSGNRVLLNVGGKPLEVAGDQCVRAANAQRWYHDLSGWDLNTGLTAVGLVHNNLQQDGGFLPQSLQVDARAVEVRVDQYNLNFGDPGNWTLSFYTYDSVATILTTDTVSVAMGNFQYVTTVGAIGRDLTAGTYWGCTFTGPACDSILVRASITFDRAA